MPAVGFVCVARARLPRGANAPGGGRFEVCPQTSQQCHARRIGNGARLVRGARRPSIDPRKRLPNCAVELQLQDQRPDREREDSRSRATRRISDHEYDEMSTVKIL